MKEINTKTYKIAFGQSGYSLLNSLIENNKYSKVSVLVDDNTEKYFKSLNQLNKSLALENLSMGMSADYLDAIKHGSNFVRIGSSIFGPRS